jgi:hypothetical protein
LTYQDGFAQTHLDNEDGDQWPAWLQSRAWRTLSRWHSPVFLLSGIASLLGVLSTRLARVADRVDALAEQLEADGPIDRRKLRRRLAYLQRRSFGLALLFTMGASAHS